ncbi:MAG TPA: WD40 repeat domain-containing protein [Gemmataceae bacterium]|nr:WD40 repeat domain-containing protein [Gemmataceae bacterium]
MIELTGHRGLVMALAYSPDGRALVSASADGTARLWDLTTGKLTATLQSPEARAYCVAFSPDGKTLAVGYGGSLGLLQLWDIDRLSRRREQWVANPTTTRGVAFSPDGRVITTVGDASEVRAWRPSGERIWAAAVPVNIVAAVAFNLDGTRLAAVTARPGMISVLSAKDGELYRSRWQVADWGYSVAFHPAGNRLAAGLGQKVILWDPADYREPPVWPAHVGAVLGVAFTPDGQTLLTGGADGLVKLWDPTGRLIHILDWKVGEVGAVAFSPEGLTAAAGGYDTILVWDVGA